MTTLRGGQHGEKTSLENKCVLDTQDTLKKNFTCAENLNGLFVVLQSGALYMMWYSEMHIMAHSYVCAVPHSRECYVTLQYVCNRFLICLTWLIHICAMTHSYVCHDSFICARWLIHMCAMTHSYVCHHPAICVQSIIDLRDTTDSHVCHDSGDNIRVPNNDTYVQTAILFIELTLFQNRTVRHDRLSRWFICGPGLSS